MGRKVAPGGRMCRVDTYSGPPYHERIGKGLVSWGLGVVCPLAVFLPA